MIHLVHVPCGGKGVVGAASASVEAVGGDGVGVGGGGGGVDVGVSEGDGGLQPGGLGLRLGPQQRRL